MNAVLIDLVKKNSQNFLSTTIHNLNSSYFENENNLEIVFQQFMKTTTHFHSGIVLFDNCKAAENVLRVVSLYAKIRMNDMQIL